MFFWKFEKSRLTKSNELAVIHLLISLSVAAVNTVWALYFSSFGLSDSLIGFISGALILLSAVICIFSTSILERYDENKIIIFTLIFGGLSYLFIAFFHNLYFFLFLAVILFVLGVFRINAFDITFRDNTPSKELNQQEGLYYALMNLGWLIGPLIAGYFLLKLGMSSVFVFGAIFLFLSVIMFIVMHLKRVHKPISSIDANFFKNVKDFFRNKELVLSYFMSAGLYAWFGMIYIYTPLFIVSKGISASYVGVFFALTVVPQILFEYKFGKLSEKIGIKIFFVLGYFGLMLFSVLAFVFTNIYLQMLFLIMAGIFVAGIEPLTDAFFFKNVRKTEEEKYYPVYLSSKFLGDFGVKIIIAVILLFFSVDYAYLVVAILCYLSLYLATKIRKKDKFGL